ncbi:MAG: DNA gyrase inhibitor YacG [Holosporaceae bacterium]|nr:DNA gyrase inhibitor YacG [Holosporaceae bacterium]
MKRCLICGKNFDTFDYDPFCSIRCKNVDLGRWLDESYFVFEKKIEDGSGQSSQFALYECMERPDSSVGRAED